MNSFVAVLKVFLMAEIVSSPIIFMKPTVKVIRAQVTTDFSCQICISIQLETRPESCSFQR